MWAKLGQSVAKYLLIPLIQQLGSKIIKSIQHWMAERERKKQDELAKIKGEEYQNAKPGTDSDEFGNLP
jgi:hypothetical protein